MLSNDTPRPTFKASLLEEQAQVVNRYPFPLYSILHFRFYIKILWHEEWIRPLLCNGALRTFSRLQRLTQQYRSWCFLWGSCRCYMTRTNWKTQQYSQSRETVTIFFLLDMYVFEKWGLLLDEGRGRPFCGGATFVAPQFQHEYIRAVTAPRPLWALWPALN
jgi:hypothetical protein